MIEIKIYKPDQLIKDAAKHGELVVFVGAGASMLCGSPDWKGFANQVVSSIEKDGLLSFLEAEQLRTLGDPRRTLSIAMALAGDGKVGIDFDSIFHPPRPDATGTELYDLLSSLRPVFVTTNYDKWLDDAAPGDLSTEVAAGKESVPAKRPSSGPKYYRREHLSPALLTERGAVIHLHGSYTEPDSMVVSLKDYIEHYADPRVQGFLSAMFKNHTVLFVGYGLAELEVLDYIIRSNDSLKTEVAEPRHFLLYAHRSTESVQTGFIERFFRDQCGVNVIRYCIDEKGYAEVLEVFKSWSSELDVREPTTLDLQAHLDRCVASPGDIQRESAMRLLEKHPALASYFVNSLRDIIWFGDLEKFGLFDPKHSPGVKSIKTENGSAYQADGWPALRYLEQVSASAQGEIANRIAEIVRRISADAKDRGIDNWRTWWSLATIFSQLPLEFIADKDIEMMRSWLIGRFDSSMVGQEMGAKLLPRLLESSDAADLRRAIALVDVLSMVNEKSGGQI